MLYFVCVVLQDQESDEQGTDGTCKDVDKDTEWRDTEMVCSHLPW